MVTSVVKKTVSPEGQLMDIDELMRYLKLKKSAIYDLVHRKRIPHIKLGQRLRFRKDLVDIWINNSIKLPYKMKILYNTAIGDSDCMDKADGGRTK